MEVIVRTVVFKVIGISAMLVGALVAPAFASTATVSVSDQGYIFGSEGDVVSLQSIPVSSEYQGQTRTVTVETLNNFSVHEGNVLTVVSGDSTSEIISVEGVADGAVSESFDLVLGETIELSVTLGESGSSSLTVDVTHEPSVEIQVESVIADVCDTTTTGDASSDDASSDCDVEEVVTEIPVAAPAKAVTGEPVYAG